MKNTENKTIVKSGSTALELVDYFSAYLGSICYIYVISTSGGSEIKGGGIKNK